MTEFLKTLLFLNIQGSVLVILLLLLKRIIQKSFSGRAQRNMWLLAALIFLLPVWKIVPTDASAPIILPYNAEEILTYETQEYTAVIEENEEGKLMPVTNVYTAKYDLKPWIWGTGICVFLLLNIGSYVVFLIKKRKESTEVNEDEVFISTLLDMGIKRKIKLKQCTDADSPMLTGVFFPVVYMPGRELCSEDTKYIYLHELTHYKHKDLLFKWFVCIINAINWFNPFMYLIMKNLNEACELYCDEAVTKYMDDEGKKAYMNTILNLVVKG